MLILNSVTMCTGFVQNFESLVAVRLLLGFMEAGLFVSCIANLFSPRDRLLTSTLAWC